MVREKEYNSIMWQKVKNIYHLLVAIFANLVYGFPAKKLTVIGVTGTDGKTTTVNLIYHLLKEAGYPVSMISTVGAIIHGKESDIGFHVTTPSSIKLQQFLAEAAKGKGRQYLVLEVTSHALDQNRVWGIPFEIGVLTNITHEHLDYHKTYAEYVQAKLQLLNRARIAMVNKDDRSYHKVKYFLRKSLRVITYGAKDGVDMSFSDIKIPHSIEELYNKYNALAAAIAVMQLGVSHEIVEKALKTFILPRGRSEIVYEKGFTVMIDFAHTPNAFEQLLSSLRERTEGKLIHVFGSAGDRDISKRPEMGKVASFYDDVIILTSEDPRKEDSEKIMQEIQNGIDSKRKVEVYTIADRKMAIKKAISMAKKGDFVVCTGKAHEKSMNYGKGEEPWDEFRVVATVLESKHL